MNNRMYISQHIYRGEILWERAALNEIQLNQVISEVRHRQINWQNQSLIQRLTSLDQIKEILLSCSTQLSNMISEEVGRTLPECQAEIKKSINLIDYYKEIAPSVLQPETIPTQAELSEVHYEPLGVIFAVMPWNYPIWQPLRFAIPALCAGNACLIKPAPTVGRVSDFFFSQLCEEIPLKMVLLADEAVPRVIEETEGFAFTGSVATGRLLAAHAGWHLKKTVLELGGSNAFIVFADADIEKAAREISYSRFRDAGQSCNAAKRVIVLREKAADFIDTLIHYAKQISYGDPALPTSCMGPLHLPHAARDMQTFVEEAVQQGAICRLGGFLPENTIFYPPTILENVAFYSRVWQEEVFGPVLPIVVVDSEDEAITLANRSTFGLGAAIYSQDIPKAQKYAKALKVGSVYINHPTVSNMRMPFGGVKNSGYGRELAEKGLTEFVNIKSYWQK